MVLPNRQPIKRFRTLPPHRLHPLLLIPLVLHRAVIPKPPNLQYYIMSDDSTALDLSSVQEALPTDEEYHHPTTEKGRHGENKTAKEEDDPQDDKPEGDTPEDPAENPASDEPPTASDDAPAAEPTPDEAGEQVPPASDEPPVPESDEPLAPEEGDGEESPPA
jgi:hypothetical protein